MKSTKLERAQSLINKGDLVQAEKLLQSQLKKSRKDFHTHYLLGTVELSLGKKQKALNTFSAAVTLKPDHTHALLFLGNLLHEMGRHQEALGHLENAVRLNPQSAEFLNSLGSTQAALGHLEEAKRCFEQAIELQPSFSLPYTNLGNLLLVNNRYGEAIPYLMKAVEFAPNSSDAHLNLGFSYYQLGQYTKASREYRKAIRLAPGRCEGYVNMGELKRNQKQYPEAVRYQEKALEINPSSLGAKQGLATTYLSWGINQKAEEYFRAVLQKKPDHLPCALGLVTVLTRQGQFSEALSFADSLIAKHPENNALIANKADTLEKMGEKEQAYNTVKEVFARDPLQPDIASVMVKLCHQFDRCDEAIPALEKILDTHENLQPDYKVQSHFALGDSLDKAGQYDQAFHHYELGNKLVGLRLARAQHRQSIDRLINTFNREWLDQGPATGSNSQSPVFVFGMPRSGTTLIEQIIGSHPQAYPAGELLQISNYAQELQMHCNSQRRFPEAIRDCDGSHLKPLAESYLADINSLSGGAARMVDKMPENFLYLGFMWLLFPNATFIHASRNKVDTCLSCYFQNFVGLHHYAFDLGDLGFYYTEYERLMRHWEGLLGDRILKVEYEELVANQEQVSRQIIAHCGLEWDEQCLQFHQSKRFAKTASYDQVRKPIYTKSVERWRNYASHLGPLLDELGYEDETAQAER